MTLEIRDSEVIEFPCLSANANSHRPGFETMFAITDAANSFMSADASGFWKRIFVRAGRTSESTRMVALSSTHDTLYKAFKLGALPSGSDSKSTSVLAPRVAICSLQLFVRVIFPTIEAIATLTLIEPVVKEFQEPTKILLICLFYRLHRLIED